MLLSLTQPYLFPLFAKEPDGEHECPDRVCVVYGRNICHARERDRGVPMVMEEEQ